jgi:hypothetical protein
MRRFARRRVDSADPWLDFGRLSLLNLLIDKNPFFFVNAPTSTLLIHKKLWTNQIRPQFIVAKPSSVKNEDHEKILVSRCAAIGRTDRE